MQKHSSLSADVFFNAMFCARSHPAPNHNNHILIVQCLVNLLADEMVLFCSGEKLHFSKLAQRVSCVHVFVLKKLDLTSTCLLPSHEIRRHPAEADHDFPKLWTSAVQANEVSNTGSDCMITHYLF